VIQHILENGKSQDDKNKIVKSIKGKVLELSNHKFASNVIEMCIKYSTEKDRRDIIDEILEVNSAVPPTDADSEEATMNQALYQMIQDRYGNYVIQQCIEASSGKQREFLVEKITKCANLLKKQANYSRHVYNFLEKLSTEGVYGFIAASKEGRDNGNYYGGGKQPGGYKQQR
jgi:pumilio RNA-binding family